MAFEQGGIFIVPYLLLYRTPVYTASSMVPPRLSHITTSQVYEKLIVLTRTPQDFIIFATIILYYIIYIICFASVDISFLGVTISHVTLSCSQYLYNLTPFIKFVLSFNNF